MTEDIPIDALKGFLERQRRRANAAVVGVNIYLQADDAIYHIDAEQLQREWAKEREKEQQIKDHAESFCARSGATASYHHVGRRYDLTIEIHPPEKAGAYVEDARKCFPQYRFTLTIDPNEKSQLHFLERFVELHELDRGETD